MKNREKYKNELMNVIKMDGRICEFVKKHDVFRMIGTDWESFCGETDCPACTTVLQLWLDEEYEEPEVDWDNVPVDTLVRVRDEEDEEWLLRYFKIFDEMPFGYQDGHNYAVFADGASSVTSDGCPEHWNYCELVEDTDDK